MPEPVAQRIVPGAPPPAPLSKTQKKKRKAKAPGDAPATTDSPSVAVSEKTPEPTEVQESTPAPESLTRSESHATPLPEEDVLLKPSPIVDLVHKRLKATTKKISRITIYAATDPEKLNDDQKRTLKTLPTLEAIQKELGEVKKAIEVHESELVQELTVKRAEAEKAEKARIAEAVATSQSVIVGKTHGILDLLRLRSSLISGLLDISSIADAAEAAALCSVADTIISEDDEQKQAVVTGLLFGGDFDGVAYSRILEITQLAFNPPRAPTPQQEEEEVVEEEEPVLAASAVETEPEVPVVGILASSTMSSSFRFIQDSELETPVFEEGAEWIEKADAVGHEEAHAVNGVTTEAAPVDTANGPIDWAADDEGGLPSIAGLHAEFGTSGSVTPAEAVEPQAEEAAPSVNGEATGHDTAAPEDDGFTQARGGRGRGRGSFHGERRRGGFRGGERGGFRGGDRGGFRGGERGSFRGGERGSFRGGEHGGERGGFRGGFRGGERGSFRGGERGRGNGEWRGGERGGRGRNRGGPPATPTAAAPAAA